jgi:Flp pilus assembly protein TadD
MSYPRNLSLVLSVTTMLLAATVTGGCRGPEKTQKQTATEQWNAARAGVLFGLARQQYDSGNFDKSRQTVDQALKLQPGNAALRVLSAKIAIEQGKLEFAETELAAARAAAPENAEAEYLSGVVYQRWQKLQTACEFYGRAVEKAPAELAYVLARAEALVCLDRADEALRSLQEKVVYFEHSGAIRDAVGQLLVGQGRYAEAVEVLRQASILSSEDNTIREHLGLAMYCARQHGEAAGVLGRLIADPAYAERADLLLALGECQLVQGRTREARATFEKAARLAPGLVGTWWGLARAGLQVGDLDRAELALRKGLSVEPDAAEGHVLLGYLRLKQNNLPASLEAFRRASRLDPTDTVSLCMTGYVLEKSGRSAEAMQCYAAVLRLKPQDELAGRLMAGLNIHD